MEKMAVMSSVWNTCLQNVSTIDEFQKSSIGEIVKKKQKNNKKCDVTF